MYGKVLAASGGAYFLTIEHHVAPPFVGLGVLVVCGSIIYADVMNEGPQQRAVALVERIDRRLETGRRASNQRADQRQLAREERAELARIAREELEANYGVEIPPELTPEEREWVRAQAAMALDSYDGTPLL
jgi:hypothetical protein